MATWRMLFACWITKAKNTYPEYIILIAFLCNSVYKKAPNITFIRALPVFFKNEWCPTTAVQQRQLVGAVGCGTVLSGLNSLLVFDILQNHSGCIQRYSGHISPLCPLLGTALASLLHAVNDCIRLQLYRQSVFISRENIDSMYHCVSTGTRVLDSDDSSSKFYIINVQSEFDFHVTVHR